MQKECQRCGKSYSTNKETSKHCSRECYMAVVGRKNHNCQYCGKDFMPKGSDRTTFCSRECAFEWRRQVGFEITCVLCGQLFTSGMVISTKCQSCKDAEILPMSECEICGQPCNRRDAKTCSDECRKVRASRRRRVQSESKKELRPRECSHCKQEFIPEYGNKRRVFCSDKCLHCYQNKIASKKKGKSINSRARYMLRKAYGDEWVNHYEPINRTKVYTRDGGICGICGKLVAMLKVCPHPKSPTIDHIVPLSQGGSHTYENVQLAHFDCNYKKSDTGAGQMRLLGEVSRG